MLFLLHLFSKFQPFPLSFLCTNPTIKERRIGHFVHTTPRQQPAPISQQQPAHDNRQQQQRLQQTATTNMEDQTEAAMAKSAETAANLVEGAAQGARSATSTQTAAGGRGRLQRRQVRINSHRDVMPALQEALQNNTMAMLEQKLGLPREQILYGICGFMALYLIAGPGNGLLCNLIGVAYPMYMSVHAVRTEQKDDDTQWLSYWCAYALYSLFDFFADAVNQTVPLYWLLKTVFLLYLALPQTCGAHNIYVNYVDPLVDWINEKMRRFGIMG